MSKIDHFEHHHREHHADSALSVTEGVSDQPIVNPGFVRRRRPELTAEQFVEGILASDIAILSQAITLVESNNPAHYAKAQKIIEGCLPHAGKSIRVGITGVPGAGKSTFIEAIGGMVAGQGHRLAVLAIDPSSERSGGSSLAASAFLVMFPASSAPSAGSLGGVARKTRESVALCEAAGYDVIFIETVGVGQSETAVHSMVDVFMLLQIAGAGDELQGIKRGIMEMADAIVITKAEGDNLHRAGLAKRQFENALMLFPTPESGWRPKVFTSSAFAGTGLKEVWEGVGEFISFVRANGFFSSNRNRQNQYWMRETIDEALRSNFYHDPEIEELLPKYREMVLSDRMSSFVAAHDLLDKYYKK